MKRKQMGHKSCGKKIIKKYKRETDYYKKKRVAFYQPQMKANLSFCR